MCLQMDGDRFERLLQLPGVHDLITSYLAAFEGACSLITIRDRIHGVQYFRLVFFNKGGTR
jgi:hypothetical protein